MGASFEADRRGEADPAAFMDGIAAMLKELVERIKRSRTRRCCSPPAGRPSANDPLRRAVAELPRAFSAKPGLQVRAMEKQQVLRRQEKNAHKTPGHRALKDGRAKLPGCYSEKTGKTYDAMVLLEDDGNRANYKMVLTMADLRA